MLRSMSTAVSGLRAHQTMLDVLSNDIANVNTVGYKAQRASFQDVLFQTQQAPTGPSANLGSVNASQVGLGSRIGSIDNLMSQGAIQNTGNPLDLAISGEGFFRVTSDPAAFSSVNLTRAGNFQLDAQGRLVTSNGQFVVGNTVDPVTGGPTATQTLLTVPAGATSVAIDSAGLLSYIDAAGVPQQVGFLSLAKVPNPQGLQRVSDNMWLETAASGTSIVSNPSLNGIGGIASGTLELSNVDLSQEFSAMILAQRGFQANSRVITTADEILQALVNMKR